MTDIIINERRQGAVAPLRILRALRAALRLRGRRMSAYQARVAQGVSFGPTASARAVDARRALEASTRGFQGALAALQRARRTFDPSRPAVRRLERAAPRSGRSKRVPRRCLRRVETLPEAPAPGPRRAPVGGAQ